MCSNRTSKVLMRLGQMFMTCGVICLAVSIGTAYWVIRPTVDLMKTRGKSNETRVIKHYGIFVACKQGEEYEITGDCGLVLEYLNFINKATVRYIQLAMCLAMLLYAVGFSLEVVQCLPISRFRNFIAENRMVELFAAIATVLVLQAMIVFSGEIKNKAERVPGQDDETPGWSYAVAIVGLVLCVFGLLLVTMFRELPAATPGQRGGSWLRAAALTTVGNSRNTQRRRMTSAVA